MALRYLGILKLVLEIIVFLLLMVIINYVSKKMDGKSYKILNPREYFPDEEIHSLRQFGFLIIMGLCFINILYSLISIGTDVFHLAIFDIVLSLYIAIKLDKTSLKNKILLLLLIPYGSLTFLIFGNSLIGLLDFIHVPVFIYIIKLYYDKRIT